MPSFLHPISLWAGSSSAASTAGEVTASADVSVARRGEVTAGAALNVEGSFAGLPAGAGVGYRLRLYDTNDSTVLTPAAGAPHSDAFQVASFAGVTGYQPYLDPATVRGRRAAIDVKRRAADKGQLGCELYDVRTTAGGSNLQRWVTAFVGDATGISRLKNRRVEIDETLDGGSTWARFFTGRVQRVALRERLRFALTFRDASEELEWDVFYNRPHASVTYAHPAPLLPNGLAHDYGNLPVLGRVAARYATWSSSASGGGRWLLVNGTGDLFQRQLVRAHDALIEAASAHRPGDVLTALRVRTTEGDFHVGRFYLPLGNQGGNYHRGQFVNWTADDARNVTAIGLAEVDTADPNHVALSGIADDTQTTFELIVDGEPSEDAPLLVNDVHPVQYLADLLDGKFGRLNDDGTVAWTVPRDAASFSAPLADGSFLAARALVTEGSRLKDAIAALCEQNGLSYYFDAFGNFSLVDLRLPATLPQAVTVTQADLDPDEAPGYTDDRSGAVSWIDATYYQDRELALSTTSNVLAEPPVRIKSSKVWQIDIVDPTLDVGARPVRLDAAGLRYTLRVDPNAAADTTDDQPRDEAISAYLSRNALDYRGTFGRGPREYALTLRRTANTVAIQPGSWVILTVDELPGPSTYVRGETRLVRATERTDDGPRIRVHALDSGENVQAAAPTLGALALVSGTERHDVTVSVTRNVDSDPVALWVAVTEQSVGTRPAAASTRWLLNQTVEADGTATIAGLPAGKRAWVRARSMPTDTTRLPSAYAFPSGAGFIDLNALPTPTTLVATVSGGTITLTWDHPTDGDLFGVMPLLNGADALADPLPPGSTRFVFEGLAAFTFYTVGVQYIDQIGSRGPAATTSATTGTLGTLVEPTGMSVLQGRASDNSLPPINEVSLGYGIKVGWRSAPSEARVRVQVATTTAFAPAATDVLVTSGASFAYLFTALDNQVRFVRARCERDGWNSSPWSEIVSALPTVLQKSEPTFDTFAGGSADIIEREDGQIELRVASNDADTDAAYYAVARDPSPADFPTVTTLDNRIERTNMPATVQLGRLYAGEEVYISVGFYHETLGFGQVTYAHHVGTTPKASNLINNPTESGTLEKWTPNGATIVQRAWGGSTVPVVGVFATSGTGNRVPLTDRFTIAFGRAYEVSGYVQTDRDSGEIRVTIDATTADGTSRPTTAYFKATRTSATGSYGVLLATTMPEQVVGGWYPFTFYVMPPETNDEALWSLGFGNQANLKYAADVRQLRFTFQNNANDATGKTIWLASPVVREIGEGGTTRSAMIATDTGMLRETVVQADPTALRTLTRGMQTGTARHGNAVTFSPAFQNIPLLAFSGGITYQPDSTEWSGTYDSTAPQYEHTFAKDLTASGFTLNAQLKQLIGTLTAQTDTFAGSTLTAEGASEEVNLDPGAAHDDTYVVQYDVTLDQKTTGASEVTVAVDSNDGGGGGWVERGTKNYSQEGVGVLSRSNETQTITVAGLGLNDDLRVRIKDFTVYVGTAVLTVTADEARYTTSSGTLSVASKTPETTDLVTWVAREET